MSTAAKTLFTGSEERVLDDKGRVTLLADWRTGFSDQDQFLATPAPGGYISVLPPAEVQKLHDKFAEIPLNDAEAQDELAAFSAASQTITFDKQGRISLKPSLLQYAGISKEVVLAGSFSKFNIYSPARWAEIQAKRTQTGGMSGFLGRYKI